MFLANAITYMLVSSAWIGHTVQAATAYICRLVRLSGGRINCTIYTKPKLYADDNPSNDVGKNAQHCHSVAAIFQMSAF